MRWLIINFPDENGIHDVGWWQIILLESENVRETFGPLEQFGAVFFCRTSPKLAQTLFGVRLPKAQAVSFQSMWETHVNPIIDHSNISEPKDFGIMYYIIPNNWRYLCTVHKSLKATSTPSLVGTSGSSPTIGGELEGRCWVFMWPVGFSYLRWSSWWVVLVGLSHGSHGFGHPIETCASTAYGSLGRSQQTAATAFWTW